MKNKIIQVFVFAIFLITIAYSFDFEGILEDALGSLIGDPQNFCPNFSPSFSFLGLPDELNFLVLSGIAIFASFLISLFFYMIARLLDHPAAGSILAVKTSDLLTVLLILLAFSSLYMSLYLPSGSLIRNYHDYAFEYNADLIKRIVSVYPTLFLVNSMYYAFYNYQVPLAVGRNNIFGFHLNIGPIFKPLIDVSTTLTSYLGIILGEFIGKQYFLCFVRVSLLPLLFPVGVVLRSFNATKGAGASLMALAIAFFTVYPAMLSMNYAIYNISTLHYYDAGVSETQSMNTFNKFLGIGTFGAAAFGGVKLIQILRNYGFVNGGIFLGKLIVSAVLGVLSIAVFFHVINLYIELMDIMFLYGLLLPAINIFITLNVAREIARTLSIDLDLSSFMRLI